MRASNHPEENPFDGSSPSRELRWPEPALEPAIVRNLCDELSAGQPCQLRTKLELVREHAPLSLPQLLELVRGTDDQPSLAILAASLKSLLEPGTADDFSGLMPAVAHVARALLLDASPDHQSAKKVTHVLLSDILREMGKSEKVHRLLLSGLDAQARQDLFSAIIDGDQLDAGYWSCLELQALSEPTLDNLQRVFDAHELIRDEVGGGGLPSMALFRAVATMAERDFQGVFEVVLGEFNRAADKEVQSDYDYQMLEHAVSGLAQAAMTQADGLCSRLDPSKPRHFRLATEVAIDLGATTVGSGRRVLLGPIRERVLEVIGAREGAPPDLAVLALAHRALLATSDAAADLHSVHLFVDRALEAPPQAELVPLLDELAAAFERVHSVSATEPLPPIPEGSYLEPSPLPPSGLCAQPMVPPPILSPEALNDYVSNAALELAAIKKRSQAVVLASEIEEAIRGNLAGRRSHEEGNLFVGRDEARAFIRRLNFFLEKRLFVAAAALIPEALGVLRGSDDLGIGAGSEVLARALTELAVTIHDQEWLRSVVQARLSPADWAFLRSAHGGDPSDYQGASELVALAALSLRALLEDDSQWQHDLLDLASSPGITPGNFMTPCFIAELRSPGSWLQIVEKHDLRRHSPEVLWPIAVGARLSLAESFPQIFSLLGSSQGDTVTKGLLLAQSLRCDLTDEQREECRVMASMYLNEPGQLGVDALVTFSCFASEPGSAREINRTAISAVAAGDASFLATRALAARRAAENCILGADKVREIDLLGVSLGMES